MVDPVWTLIDDQDNNERKLWAMVDDGTDLYVIETADGRFDLIERVDAREPNAGYIVTPPGPASGWLPYVDDRPGPGPFETLEEARVAYLAVTARMRSARRDSSNPWLLHELTDDTPDLDWVELPDGSKYTVERYLAKLRVEGRKAAALFEKARKERRQADYVDKAIF
jgi:hypothetical protein